MQKKNWVTITVIFALLSILFCLLFYFKTKEEVYIGFVLFLVSGLTLLASISKKHI